MVRAESKSLKTPLTTSEDLHCGTQTGYTASQGHGETVSPVQGELAKLAFLVVSFQIREQLGSRQNL